MASRSGARPEPSQSVLVAAKRGRELVGEPLFSRGEQQPLARGRVKVEEGQMVLCRTDRRGAQPVAALGRADRARDVVAALLSERGLRPSFAKRLERESRDSTERLAKDAGPRRDLISEPTFTVDPASARDFDDAVSARREGDGFRLWIHIADVAAHVQPESGLDREARERANSTYAPGIVSPMLPRALSNEACSLNPGVERLAVTSEIELGPQAQVRSASFYRSLDWK
jgi:ribonuclease R